MSPRPPTSSSSGWAPRAASPRTSSRAPGLDVVALEAGPRLDPGSMTLDEIRNDIHSWLSEPKARDEVPPAHRRRPSRGPHTGRC